MNVNLIKNKLIKCRRKFDIRKFNFNVLRESGLGYIIYINYVMDDGILLRAFKSLTNAQLIELMAIGSVEYQIKYLKEVAKNLTENNLAFGLINNAKYNKKNSSEMKNRQIKNKIHPLSLKERTWQALNTFDSYKRKIYNNLSVDIRNLLYYNNLALLKFKSLEKEDIYKFSKLAPLEQLDFILKNFPITYVKRDMQPIVNQRMKILYTSINNNDLKNQRVQNITNNLNTGLNTVLNAGLNTKINTIRDGKSIGQTGKFIFIK